LCRQREDGIQYPGWQENEPSTTDPGSEINVSNFTGLTQPPDNLLCGAFVCIEILTQAGKATKINEDGEVEIATSEQTISENCDIKIPVIPSLKPFHDDQVGVDIVAHAHPDDFGNDFNPGCVGNSEISNEDKDVHAIFGILSTIPMNHLILIQRLILSLHSKMVKRLKQHYIAN
jgi:hypothetical protein